MAALSHHELDAFVGSSSRAILLTLFWAVLMPFAWVWFVGVLLATGLYVLVVRLRRSDRRFGEDASLDMETVAALAVIPITGLIATVGTSLAFYLWSQEPSGAAWGGGENRETGWTVFNTTIALSGGLIVALVAMIARHQSGRATLPFEPDVDPQRGISALRKLRTSTTSAFLVGRYRFAAERVNESLRNADATAPTFREAVRWLFRLPRDRHQLVVLLGASAAWFVVVVSLGGRWWSVLAALLLSLTSLVAVGAVTGLAVYYDQLRWGRREARLHPPRAEMLRALTCRPPGWRP